MRVWENQENLREPKGIWEIYESLKEIGKLKKNLSEFWGISNNLEKSKRI